MTGKSGGLSGRLYLHNGKQGEQVQAGEKDKSGALHQVPGAADVAVLLTTVTAVSSLLPSSCLPGRSVHLESGRFPRT